jgi:tRNA(fMet)-specific endonuclease VapC
MPGFLLDTDHLGQTLNPISIVRERIYQKRREGVKIGTCVPVLCELEVGIRQMVRADQSRRELAKLMSQIRLWPVDQTIVAGYGEIHLDLRRRGRVLSQVDMMLTSLARVMNLTILTTDRDFEALPDIRTEDWTTGPT